MPTHYKQEAAPETKQLLRDIAGLNRNRDCRYSIAELLAQCWNGRSWHELTNMEGAIFDRLQDSGLMTCRNGFIYSTSNNAIKRTGPGAKHA